LKKSLTIIQVVPEKSTHMTNFNAIVSITETKIYNLNTD